MARAVMEGLGFLNRDVIERAEAAAGLRAPRILLAGGGARGDWPQIRADATGREIAVPDLHHAGLVGCLATALTGMGRFATVAEAARAVTGPPRILRPDPSGRDRMDAIFEAFRAAVPAAAEAGRRLAAATAAAAIRKEAS